MELKLNVLLAKTDHLSTVWKNGILDYVKFFKSSQPAFRGEKKTYEAKAGFADAPTNRSLKLVVTTVDEKLKWLHEISADYIDALFSQEKTNASGVSKATLKVDDIVFGEFTSLELLRLKSLIENGTFKEMYENIPVRTEDENWTASDNESYTGRNIFQTDRIDSVAKTTVKESYILTDPNIDKTGSKAYTPQVAQKDTIVEVGNYTFQKYSGEWSHMQRANVLLRRSKLLTAVIEALKVANEVPAIASDMTADKLFNYLHTGKL